MICCDIHKGKVEEGGWGGTECLPTCAEFDVNVNVPILAVASGTPRALASATREVAMYVRSLGATLIGSSAVTIEIATREAMSCRTRPSLRTHQTP